MAHSIGREYLAIPGPSVVPERVLRAMHVPAPDIYSGPFVDMVPGLVRDLKSIARTRHHLAIYVGNGHGVWEAALANILAPGERVLVLVTGLFGHGWAEMARGLQIDAQVIDFGTKSAIDPARLQRELEADKEHRIKAVMAVHVDTSSSLRNDIASLRAALDAAGHPAMLLVDCIASLGCERYEMDEWGVDVTVAACQKGLMTPPGIGFVFFNDKAAAARKSVRVSKYWDWVPRAEPEAFYQYFGGTAPTHHLIGLREAVDMILEEGLEAVWARHEQLARAYWAAVEALGRQGPLRLHLADEAIRSHAVTTLAVGAPLGTQLRDWLSRNAGVTLGVGLGMNSDDDPDADGFFRIGHMGHVNKHMVLGVIGALQTALLALQIPHAAGALEEAAKILADT